MSNWYKKCKSEESERFEGDKLDTQLLCCQYPENRRREPYKKKKGRNYPKGAKVAGRGLYNQLEGNESRSGGDWLQERIDENEKLEGIHVRQLKEYARNKQFRLFNDYVEQLRAEFNRNRIESMITRAMHGVKI